jgi:hypothetical protein
MMTKEEVLEHLRKAKVAHTKWVQKAHLLISDIKVEKDAIPVNATDCGFGMWFYSDAQKLNALSNNPLECMQSIESLHMKLHNVYLEIYQIYFNKPSKGFFQSLFGLKKEKITPEERAQAHQSYAELEAISMQLIEELNRLERRIIALPDEKIAQLK